MTSPDTFIQEIDRSHYIPNFTNEVAAYVGYFEKGPINQPVFITDINQFKLTFGRGIGLSKNDWYQVYNYLQYASGIWVVRTAGTAQVNSAIASPIYIENDYDFEQQTETLPLHLNGVGVWARTAGTMGNLLKIAIIEKDDYDNNVTVNGTYLAQDQFTFFETGFLGLMVFRNDKLVEKFYLDKTELQDFETNQNSGYVYIKFDANENNVLPFFGDGSENTSGGSQPIQELSGGLTTYAKSEDFQESYDILKNREEYDIDIIIGNELCNEYAVEVAEDRRDCIAFIGVPTTFKEVLQGQENVNEDILYTQDGKAIFISEWNLTKKLSPKNKERFDNYIASIPESQFVHFTGNVKTQINGFTGRKEIVNLAGDAAGLKSQASLERPWSHGAGLERGIIKNGEEILISFSEKDRNFYYQKGLNFIENGILATQKTYYSKQSSFNRVNIRSLFNHLEKTVEKALRRYVFSENREAVRRAISLDVKKILMEMKQNNGIDAGRVHAYPSPTNPDEIIVDIYVKPIYVAEYIQLRMQNVGTNTISNILSSTLG